MLLDTSGNFGALIFGLQYFVLSLSLFTPSSSYFCRIFSMAFALVFTVEIHCITPIFFIYDVLSGFLLFHSCEEAQPVLFWRGSDIHYCILMSNETSETNFWIWHLTTLCSFMHLPLCSSLFLCGASSDVYSLFAVVYLLV